MLIPLDAFLALTAITGGLRLLTGVAGAAYNLHVFYLALRLLIAPLAGIQWGTQGSARPTV